LEPEFGGRKEEGKGCSGLTYNLVWIGQEGGKKDGKERRVMRLEGRERKIKKKKDVIAAYDRVGGEERPDWAHARRYGRREERAAIALVATKRGGAIDAQLESNTKRKGTSIGDIDITGGKRKKEMRYSAISRKEYQRAGDQVFRSTQTFAPLCPMRQRREGPKITRSVNKKRKEKRKKKSIDGGNYGDCRPDQQDELKKEEGEKHSIIAARPEKKEVKENSFSNPPSLRLMGKKGRKVKDLC